MKNPPTSKQDPATILVVDNDQATLKLLSDKLPAHGYHVQTAAGGASALEFVQKSLPDLILLDMDMSDMDGAEVCQRLKQHEKCHKIPILFLSDLADTDKRIKGFTAGANDFISKPILIEEVLARINTHITLSRLRRKQEEQVVERTAEKRLLNAYNEIEHLKQKLHQENLYPKRIKVLHSHDRIKGKSQAILSTLSQAEMVAPQATTVLILGETGTGKELLAHAIHNVSPRRDLTMVTINCASLPATLIEGELFGREKGAYTGALTKQAGRFELADKSTLFLDEIGDLPLDLQAKLLRVIEEGQFERLGCAKTLTVDVRILAATNHDLEQAVNKGKFRMDLYYRLCAYPITVPPLRDRRDDIPLLVWAFVKDFGKRMGKQVEKIPKNSMDKLQSYSWPGNVRELRNVVERAMILHSGPTLNFEEIGSTNSETNKSMVLQEVERNHILHVLDSSQWKVSGKNGAAETLGLTESTLRARMGKLGIKRGDNRQNLT